MGSFRVLFTYYLRAAGRHRWIGVIVKWLVCGSGWLGVYTIPYQFESSARLFVDADAVLTSLLRGLAVDLAPTTQLEILQRTLLSRPNMEKLVSKAGLDLRVSSPSERERLVTQLSSGVKVVPQTRNLFTITYRDQSPKMAHDVVQALLTIFVERATGGLHADMENARRILGRQIQSYEQQLQRQADFRARYAEILPADNNPDGSALEGARNVALALEGRLQDALTSRDALEQELKNTAPMLMVESGGLNGLGGPIAKTRLHEAEDQLRILLLKDTDQHPDVVAQHKLIASLKDPPTKTIMLPDVALGQNGGRDALNSMMKRSLPDGVYEQLKVKLVNAAASVVARQRQRSDAVRYRERLEMQRDQPGLIAEYQNTDRNYGVLQRNYEQLLSRLQSANMAQAADTQAEKLKLQAIDPPGIPRLPVAPNRLLLVTSVLLGGLASGADVTALFGQADRSFSTLSGLRTLGLTVLGGISVLALISFRRRLLIVVRFGAAVALLVGVYGGLVVRILRSAVLI